MFEPIIVGAVLYDPKVSVIWDIIREFFEGRGVPMDVVFYTNYELQVSALAKGHIHIAWNSPLAWLDSTRKAECRAIAMRDTDRDRVSHVVVRKDSGIDSIAGLAGKTIAAGALDSPQAHLIPIDFLLEQGIDFEVQRFDLLVGKHGDHVGGELEAFRSLERGEAAASCMIDLNWASWIKDGTIDGDTFAILATTKPYDHCVFTVRNDFDRAREKVWLDALFSMRYDDPDHRQMMDLEGLKKWEPGRTTGFGPLTHAVEKLGFFQR
jgi:phosphonate transport system substrate-binding protein